MNRFSRQKINKATEILNNTTDHNLYVQDSISKKNPEDTFFSSPPGIFSRVDHILGHKTSLNRFKRIEIIQSIFSNHNSMKLEVNYNKKSGNRTNI